MHGCRGTIEVWRDEHEHERSEAWRARVDSNHRPSA